MTRVTKDSIEGVELDEKKLQKCRRKGEGNRRNIEVNMGFTG
jgi:hypothetical protein